MARVGLPVGALATLRPTGRGVGFLAAGVVGLVAAYPSGWPALLLVSAFLIGAVVAGALAVVLAPAVLDVQRRIDPAVAEQGEPILVRLSVGGSSAGSLEWAEELPRSLTVTGDAAGRLPAVRPGRSAVLLEYTLTGHRRGALPVGPLRIVRTDALGLVVTRRRVGPVDQVVVLPRIRPVEPPHAIRRVDPDARASTEFGAVGDQRDIVARDYRPGDPLRSVDWRATARRGELMVRMEAAATASAAALVLDARASAWSDAGLFEAAVEYAASLAGALDERRAAVRFVSGRAARLADGVVPALIGLATARREDADPVEELVHAVADAGAQIVHVITGDLDARPLLRLPSLRGEATGFVTVVSRGASQPEVAPRWHVRVLHPDGITEAGRG